MILGQISEEHYSLNPIFYRKMGYFLAPPMKSKKFWQFKKKMKLFFDI